MNNTKLDSRFFESTRGRIVMLLRTTTMTVSEISGRLNLTDNAIRAHLHTLERDRLVEQKGVIKGFRTPHHTFGLTDEARHLFPKPYAFLFNKLVETLKKTLSPGAILNSLRDIGRSIARENTSPDDTDLPGRLNDVLKALEALGGSARLETENGKTVIKSESCPFNEAVSEHPEVCKVAESMVAEIVGKPAREVCDRTASPKCCFEIDAA